MREVVMSAWSQYHTEAMQQLASEPLTRTSTA